MDKSFECAVCFRRYKMKRSLYKHIIKEKHCIYNNLPLSELKVTLPSKWKYGNCQISDVTTENSSLSMYIYDVHNKNDVLTWMSSYMKVNGFRFVYRSSAKNKNGKIYIIFRCEHFQDANRKTKRKKKIKGTGCESVMYFILERGLAEVKIFKVRHNHPIDSSAILAFLKPTAEVERIFIAMFYNGLRPGEALSSYKNHVKLQLEDDIEYLKFSTDRSKMPDYDWVRHLFNKNFTKNNDFIRITENIEELKDCINKTNAEFNTTVCTYLETDTKKNFIVAIVTPFMFRVSTMKNAAELIFFDSVGCVDRLGLRVFLITTRINAGGVPLGILIITDESERVIQEALYQFLQLYTQDSFGGHFKLGPLYFITEDFESGIAALRKVFPNSRHFLCSFHILQSVYRWLSASVNSISIPERNEIYLNVKKMVYADSSLELDNIYNYLVNKYKVNQRLIRYLSTLYKKKDKWSLLFRQNTLLPGLNTNNIGESGLRVLKRKILHRIITQSPAQLLDYLVHDCEEFCKNKIISSAFEKSTNTLNKSQLNSQYYFSTDMTGNMVTIINRETNTKYSINADVGICTCYAGANGGYCKHQQFLDEEIEIINYPPSKTMNESSKLELFYLVTGNIAVPPENFFCPPNHETDEIEFVSVEPEENFDPVKTRFSDEANNDEQREQSIREGKYEIQDLKRNVNRLIDIMQKNPAMYVGALKSYNKNLAALANRPSEIIPSLYSFNIERRDFKEEN